MRFKSITVIAAITLALMAAGCNKKQPEQSGDAKPQAMCPVMDLPIEKQFFADYDGKRIYFCHQVCVDTFNKDPEKYMKILKDWGVTLEDAPNP